MWTYEELGLWRPCPPASADLDHVPTALAWREDGDAYHLEGRLPGFRKRDVALTARDREIEIRAERDRGLWRRERSSWRRIVTLPDGADATDIDAQFAKGVLSIRVAKRAHLRRRRVPIRVNGELPRDTSQATALIRTTWLQRLTSAVRSLFGASASA